MEILPFREPHKARPARQGLLFIRCESEKGSERDKGSTLGPYPLKAGWLLAE